MAKVEIEESELASLTQVSKFANSALANPKTREQMLRIQKTLNPDAIIPEIDATEGVMKAVQSVAESVASLKKDLEDTRVANAEAARTAELQGRVTKGQDYLRSHGYNAEGIAKVEELMLAENVSSYAAGRALFEQINPPSRPADASQRRWIAPPGGERIENNKSLWESQGDDDGWLRDAINAASPAFRQ